MKKNHYDTIIIGQGLAGSLLAWYLLQQGKRVLVIDHTSRTSASRMAAGLINPVTGKRLVRTEGIESLLPAALDLYQELESFFSTRFYHPLTMFRLFGSDADIEQWQKRVKDPDYQPYLDTQHINEHRGIHAPLGGYRQLQTGYVDTTLLLDRLTDYFRQHEAYQAANIAYDAIDISADAVKVNDLQTRQLVFCEGYHARKNPWFDWLPFNPAKGEILTVDITACHIDEMINAGHWILPIGNGRYRVGATYQWETLNEHTTEIGKEQLIQSLHKLVRGKHAPKIIAHQAGVRPCTKDRKPFIGLHPDHPCLGIFNGFGSKGSLMIPYYAARFSATLLGEHTNFVHADILRYWQNEH